MQSAINAIKSKALGIAEHLTPLLKDSKFHETGVLTPEEFVVAGDHLVYHCPTWHWASGDESRLKQYLPADKQFLITKNVPCTKRLRQVYSHNIMERVVDDDDGDGGWINAHQLEEEDEERVSSVEKKEEATATTKNNDAESYDEDDEGGEPMDMDSFISSGQVNDQCMLVDPKALTDKKSVKNDTLKDTDDDHSRHEVLETRTYDLHITYDKYYQTPRLWLVGYDEKKRPLTVAQMYEDISQDHANKTVTMETHPNLPGPPMASVHPCRHAEVMKRLMQSMEQAGSSSAEAQHSAGGSEPTAPAEKLGVHQYLMIFLKFVQAVIPTVEYDFTQNFNLSC